MTQTIPVGLCECGCGGAAPLATRNDRKRGNTKGQPQRFVFGHRKQTRIPLWDRFWAKVDAEGDCWIWTGATVKGYGLIWIDEAHRAGRVARVVWEMLIGPIPDGLTVDHRCRIRLCVNPAHLDLCTSGENARRSPLAPYWVKARRTRDRRRERSAA